MKKIVLLLEYIRVGYIKENNGQMEVDFFNSNMGKKLRDYLRPYGLTPKNFDVEFVYPQIPEPAKVNPRTGQPVSYKNPTAAQVKQPREELVKRLVAKKPDIVLPTGALGSKLLTGVGAITKSRGVPVETTLEADGDSHTFWSLPIFSIEFVSAQPNNEGIFKTDLNTLNKFLQEGDTAFETKEVNSELITDIERVREVFSYIKEHKPITAWDLETNTLKGENRGAKVLVASLSYEEGKGMTIPIEHHETPFNTFEQEEILNHLKDFVADRDIVKVGQNIGFDIRFLQLAYGFENFHNHRDTKIAYWMTVTQEVKDSFKLSDLAYELTDMGGYDKPLDDFKDQYKKNWNDSEKVRVAEEKERQEALIKEYIRENKGTKKAAREALGLEAPKVRKLVNEIDGGDFNYDWIPLEVLHPYASGDVDCTLRIHNKLYESIQTNPKWVELFTDFYPRLTVALATTEANGMYMDREYMEEAAREYNKEAEELRAKLDDHPAVQGLKDLWQTLYEAGLEEMAKPPNERDKEIAKMRNKYRDKLKDGFNPASTEDKQRLLYQVLGFKPPVERDFLNDSANNRGVREHNVKWSDFKTDRPTIEWLIAHEEGAEDICNLMLDYAKVNTVNNTFVTGLLDRIKDPKGDGVIHGSLNEVGTATSRLSSSNPNLQNFPSNVFDVDRIDYRYPVKRGFVSRFDNGAIIQLDYSSLESRVLGLVARDEVMTQGFLDGQDTHTTTASIVYGVPYEEVTREQRQAAKAVTFGKLLPT